MDRTVVTISREAGSGGSAIGYGLAARLNFTCINRGFVNLIASKARVPPREVERVEHVVAAEAPRSMAVTSAVYDDRLDPSLRPLIQSFGYGETLRGEEYIVALRAVMMDLADYGEVVLIGRGGQMLLRDRPDTFHVRILAPTELRAAQMQLEAQVTDEESLKIVRVIDGLRADLLREMGCEDINDPALYDLILHREGKTVEQCVDEILGKLREVSGKAPTGSAP